jgi:signal transduction histidine kinase
MARTVELEQPLAAWSGVADAVVDLLRFGAEAVGAAWASIEIDSHMLSWSTPTEDPPAVTVPCVSPDGSTGTIALGPCLRPNDLAGVASNTAQAIERWLDRAAEADASDDVAHRLFLSEQRLAETLIELEASNHQLENFAYIASHELLHPLRAVTAFADLLPDLVRAGNESALDGAIGRIREGTQAMQQQVTALLELASPISETGPGELFDPGEAARLAVDALDDMLCNHGANVVLAELPIVRAHPIPLQSVFHNMVLNAVRYRDPERPLRVSIDGATNQFETVITITDNGIGIDADDHDRVFGIFERAALDRSGSGIGLALARRIMQGVGGSISLESTPGVGSSFSLHFPPVESAPL